MWMSVMVLLLLHPLPHLPKGHEGSDSWLFVAVPLVIFITERTYRTYVRGKRVEVVSMHALPAKPDQPACMAGGPVEGVAQLVVRVPKGQRRFRYKPGQFLYVKIKELSEHEWHPFAITSAPEDANITVHMATKGPWTENMYRMATEADSQMSMPAAATLMVNPGHSACHPVTHGQTGYQDPRCYSVHRPQSDSAAHCGQQLPTDSQDSAWCSGQQALCCVRIDVEQPPVKLAKAPPTVHIDGPYGAPCQHFMDYDVVVLISSGIGVTPMVSILRHLVHQLSARRCGHCNQVNINMDFWLSKLYFHWILREQGGPQWFQQTLSDITSMDPGGLCDVHIHYTPAGPPTINNLLLRLAVEAEQEQHGTCLLTGVKMKARTNFGRPNVQSIIADVAARHPTAHVGVLYCGAPQLGDQLLKAIKMTNHPSMNLHKEMF